MPTSPFYAGDTAYIPKLNELANAVFNTSFPSTSFTAAKGYLYVLLADALTITLPASATAGDRIQIQSGLSTVLTATLARNGLNINSAASDLTLTAGKIYRVDLTYVNPTIGWLVAYPDAAGAPFTQSTAYASGSVGAALNVIVNVKNSPYGAKGNWNGTTGNDDTTAIQTALNAAAALRNGGSGSFNRSKYWVVIPEGRFRVTSQITVPAGVVLWCNGVIDNGLSVTTDACVLFKSGSHCGDITVWGNLGSGIQFGDLLAGEPQYCDITIGKVRCLNIGTSAPSGVQQFGVRFLGYNFTCESVDIDGGNVGLDIGGGPTYKSASDVRIDKALLYNGSTGFRISSGSEHIWIGHLVLDTVTGLGGAIDSCHAVSLPDVIAFWNEQQTATYGVYGQGMVLKIGEYSQPDPVSQLTINASFNNTNGVGVQLFNVRRSRLSFHGTNGTLGTGNAHPLTTTVQFMPKTGTASGHVVNNVGGYAVGSKSIAISGGTGAIAAGDTVSFAANGEQYTVATGVTGASGTLVLATGLVSAIANSVALVYNPSKTEKSCVIDIVSDANVSAVAGAISGQVSSRSDVYLPALAAGTTGINAAGASKFKTANTGATSLQTATGGVDGQSLTILVKDSFTTIKHNFGANGFTNSSGADIAAVSGKPYTYMFDADAGYWRQI